MWSRLRSLWRNTVHRRRADRDLDEEVGVAFDLAVDEQIRRGVDPDRARRLAVLQFGRPVAIAPASANGEPGRRSRTPARRMSRSADGCSAVAALCADRDRLPGARDRRHHHDFHARQRADAARSPRRPPGTTGRDREITPYGRGGSFPTRSTARCATTTRSSTARWRSHGAWCRRTSTPRRRRSGGSCRRTSSTCCRFRRSSDG